MFNRSPLAMLGVKVVGMIRYNFLSTYEHDHIQLHCSRRRLGRDLGEVRLRHLLRQWLALSHRDEDDRARKANLPPTSATSNATLGATRCTLPYNLRRNPSAFRTGSVDQSALVTEWVL